METDEILNDQQASPRTQKVVRLVYYLVALITSITVF
ncbi:hypothetical protein B188_19960 [Candidatus Brocadiaceae bacterium B188]|nr:hypothetical protein B188_19960 [Candidatus Brocadiaceae bacterium B188]